MVVCVLCTCGSEKNHLSTPYWRHRSHCALKVVLLTTGSQDLLYCVLIRIILYCVLYYIMYCRTLVWLKLSSKWSWDLLEENHNQDQGFTGRNRLRDYDTCRSLVMEIICAHMTTNPAKLFRVVGDFPVADDEVRIISALSQQGHNSRSQYVIFIYVTCCIPNM